MHDSYAKTPLQLFKLGLSHLAERVYIILKRHENSRTRTCWPSRETIATYLPGRLQERNIRRALRELAQRELIEIRPRHDDIGRQLSNEYVFRDISTVKKLFPSENGERSGGEGVSLTPLRGVNLTPLPPRLNRMFLKLNKYERKDRRTAAFGRAPTRSHDRERRRSKANQETEALYEHFRSVYRQKKNGMEMPEKPRHLYIVEDLIRIYTYAGATALYELWWRKGAWSRFAAESGHALEAFDRAIDKLLDSPDYGDLKRKYQDME